MPREQDGPTLRDYYVTARVRATSKPAALNEIRRAVERTGGRLVGGGVSDWRDEE